MQEGDEEQAVNTPTAASQPPPAVSAGNSALLSQAELATSNAEEAVALEEATAAVVAASPDIAHSPRSASTPSGEQAITHEKVPEAAVVAPPTTALPPNTASTPGQASEASLGKPASKKRQVLKPFVPKQDVLYHAPLLQPKCVCQEYVMPLACLVFVHTSCP